MLTVQRAKELVVDWTHAMIVELEEHLGMHPNRNPAPPAEKVEVADPEIQKVVNGLENKLTAADTELELLKGQLKAATDNIAELDAENEDLSAKLMGANASLAGATEANTQLTAELAEARKPAPIMPATITEPTLIPADAGSTGPAKGGADGQA